MPATGRMQSALRAAEEIRSSSAVAEEKDQDLSERAVVTRHVLALLDEAAAR